MADTTVDHEAPPTRQRRVMDSVQSKAQEVLAEDYDRAKTLASDAVRSRAFLYPIQGLAYFASHRSLWKPLLSKLGPYFLLPAGVTTGIFALAYVPQLAVLVFVNGPLAVFTTVLLVLNESSAISNAVARSWLLQEALLDTFDGTLVAKNQTAVVREGREVKAGGGDPMQRLGRILKSPFARFSPKALIRYLIYLLLNAIPVVGTVLFILVQARGRGQGVHGRYFQLKRWSASQQSEWLKKHAGPYTAFGLVATLLEMIPFASILFSFTNTVGAALWAADIEAKSTSMTDSTAPSLRETASKAE